MLTAARDPRLLGATLRLRERQEGLLASLEGPEGTHLWAIGRQSGKSTLAAVAAVHNAALRPDLDAMMPARRWRHVPVLAPSEDQARDFTQIAAAMVDSSPVLSGYADVRSDRVDFTIPRTDEHGRRLTARVSIRAMPSNSRSVRGLTAALVILEEMAHLRQGTGGEADERRIWEAITPAQVVFGSRARVLGISTPAGETGLFFELFRGIEAGVIPNARVQHAATWDMVPGLEAAWLDARRAEMGEDAFRQEYGAEFVAGAGQFFDLRGVTLDAEPAAPTDGRNWIAGLDPGFHADRFGVALVGESVHGSDRLVVGAVAAVEPSGPGASLQARREREDRTLRCVFDVIEPYTRQGTVRLVSDQHQAQGVRSYFGRLGLAVTIVNLTGPSQTAAFVAVRSRLADGSLRLWRHPQLVEELRRVRASDNERIDLPRFGGSHCDAASALALAVREHRWATNHHPVVGGGRPRMSLHNMRRALDGPLAPLAEPAGGIRSRMW